MRGVEVLVSVSCDIYIVLWNGLGCSGKCFRPPVVFCLCRRTGSSPLRLCLPTEPPPLLPPHRLLRKLDALCLPLIHPPLLQRGVAVRGSRRESPTLALVRSPLPLPPFSVGERGGVGGGGIWPLLPSWGLE